MKYHICINTNDHRWEIRDKNENVIFFGDSETVKEEFKKYSAF